MPYSFFPSANKGSTLTILEKGGSLYIDTHRYIVYVCACSLSLEIPNNNETCSAGNFLYRNSESPTMQVEGSQDLS